MFQCEETCKTGLWISRAHPLALPCLVEAVPSPRWWGKDRKLCRVGKRRLGREVKRVMSTRWIPWDGDIPHTKKCTPGGWQYCTVLAVVFNAHAHCIKLATKMRGVGGNPQTLWRKRGSCFAFFKKLLLYIFNHLIYLPKETFSPWDL